MSTQTKNSETPKTETLNQEPSTGTQNTLSESPKEETSSKETPSISEPSSEEGLLGEVTKEEPKVEEEPKAEEEPEEYELEFSEDSPLSEEQQEKLAEKISKFGLSESDAKELIADIEATHTTASNAVVEQISNKIKADREEMLNSELFKTEEARKESFKKIGEVVNQFGDEDFKKFLNSSSGNSLALAKFLIKINEAGANDDPTTGKGSSQDGSGTPKTLAQKWYPHLFEAEKK